jgi:hydrogenase/urease accessory protein HupE
MNRSAAARRWTALLGALAAALVVLLRSGTADAHAVGISRGDYRLDGAILSAEIALSQREVALFLPAVDLDHDGWLQSAELAAAHDAVAKTFVEGVRVEADGDACRGALESARMIDDEDGVAIRTRYVCPGPPARLTLTWPILDALPAGHRHVARLATGEATLDAVVQRGSGPWTIDVASPLAQAGGTAWAMFKLGVEHILTGADHLVFLLGLILVGGRLRSLAVVVTAFTVAHSITLALATLSIFAPSPRFVEPMIALSIAYVGVENLFVKDAKNRWRITFPFGLVHGFGFAGALREIALPRAQVPVALVSFNLGVEAGQLGVLAIVLPLVLVAQRTRGFRARGTKLASIAIAVAGAIWFVARVTSAS